MRAEQREEQGASASTYGAEGELDLGAIGRALWGRRAPILGIVLAVAVASVIGVNLIAARYKSEARVLIEGRESVFVRPEADKIGDRDRAAIDQEAVQSQVQLVLSRDLALQAIKQLKLGERPEFDPALRGPSPLRGVLALLGVVRDPLSMTAEERLLESYYARLTVYPVDKSRVIAVEFQSADPELAARAANVIAEAYLGMQQAARIEQTRAAGRWLAGEIEVLRTKVMEAEARAEEYRAKSNLLIGLNSTTLSNQQLGELNSQLSLARSQKADAEARAKLIRDLLRKGGPIEASDILNSDLIRRLGEQRATLKGQLAEQSSTLLDQHPRIKELRAQISDLERQLRVEAEKIARALENDARIAAARLETLSAGLDQLKIQAASTNEHDVQLRALDREAKAQRELLEAYLMKYREAMARDSIGAAPGDARVISRATVSNVPSFPKKLPIVLVATFAAFVLACGFVATAELLNVVPPSAPADAASAAPIFRRPEEPESAPAEDGSSPGVVEEAQSLPEISESATPSEISESPGEHAPFDLASLAKALEQAPASERRIAIVGAREGAGATTAAIMLARLIAKDARVVVVELALASPSLSRFSNDPGAPGIADLVTEGAPFSRVITRDRASRTHLVAAGASADAKAVWRSERLAMALDALARAYDWVIIDAGVAGALEAPRLARFAARAVLIASGAPESVAEIARERLVAAGFSSVDIVSAQPSPGLPAAAA